MDSKLRIFFFLLFSLTFGSSFAQSDSVRLSKITGMDTLLVSDTLLGFSSRYLGITEEDLGNNGSLRFSLIPKNPGFIYFGSSSFLGDDSLENYSSKIAITDASYILGTNKSSQLKLLHVQPVTGTIQTWIKYHRNRSEGFFQYQLNDEDHLRIGLSFTSRKSRYAAFLSGGFHDLDRQENGGILDSVYMAENYTNPRLYPVRMRDGVTNLRNRQATLSQFIQVKKHLSIVSETVISDKEHKYSGLAQNGYYSSLFLDSLNTADSSNSTVLVTGLGFKYSKGNLIVKLLANWRSGTYQSLGIDMTDRSFSGVLALKYRSEKHLLGINGEFFLSGYHTDDGILRLDYKLLDQGKPKISIYSIIQRNSPAINTTYYLSNHYFFTGIFRSVASVYLNADFHLPGEKWVAGINASHISNGIYLTNTGFSQDTSGALALSGRIRYANRIYKKWFFRGEVIGQFSGNDMIFRIPSLIGFGSIFYSGKAWSMKFNSGVSVRYYSEFMTNEYVPSLNLYRYQNSFASGNYPLIDFFFETEIRTVRLFLAVDHFLDGLMGKSFYSAPSYLMPMRTIRFGIRWKFIN